MRLGTGLWLGSSSLIGTVSLTYGRTADYNAGTSADWYVSTAGSDTTGDGSFANPYRTWQKAHDVASDGHTVKGRAGAYYEALTQTKRLTLTGYGTELPIISGGYLVTGWTACDAGDAGVVGANWANVHKATINKSVIDAALDHYHCLLLTEADTVLNLAQRRKVTTNLWEQTSSDTAYTNADGVSFALYDPDGGGAEPTEYVDTITHAAVLGTYTDAQLARTYAYIHAVSNTPAVVKVASASGGVLTLARDGDNETARVNSVGTPTYALLNILPAIAQGQWGFVDNGATIDLYVWPNNAANLAAGVTIVSKTKVLDLAATAANSVYRNLQFEYAADVGNNSTAMIEAAAGTDGIDMQQCVLRRFSHKARGAGGLLFQDCDDFVFEHNDVKDAQNQFGIWAKGGSSGGWGNRARIQYNYFQHISQSPIRCYGQREIAVRYNDFHDCGAGDHANKVPFYLGCDKILLQGNRWATDCYGYVTIQDGSRFLALNNIIPSNLGDGRCFDDQGSTGFTLAQDPSNCYAIGNLCPLAPGDTSTLNAMDFQGTTQRLWGVYGNVAHGIATTALQLISRQYNIDTKSAVSGTGEEQITDLSLLYYDAATGDWGTFPGSTLLTKTAADRTAIIEEYEGYFPDLDLRRDVLGNVWNPAASGVGPYALGAWPITADTTAPALSSLSADITGTTAACSVTTNELGGTIYWVRLADGAATPSAAQIAAGLDSAGNPAGDDGSVAVGATAGAKEFNVSGTLGTIYALFVTHEDRHGNLATPVTMDLDYPATYTPTWVASNGTNYLRRATGITGAQATTQSFVIAVTHKRTSGQNANTTGAIIATLPSTRNTNIDYTTNHRLRMIFERAAADSTTIFDMMIATQTNQHDIEFLTLYRGYDDGSVFRVQERVIKVADGTVINVADVTTALTNFLTFASTTQFDILRGAGTYERFMLWDNVTADITDAAIQAHFYDSTAHTLKDPAVAAAAIGTPLISFYGSGLSDGTNQGSGGNWSFS